MRHRIGQRLLLTSAVGIFMITFGSNAQESGQFTLGQLPAPALKTIQFYLKDVKPSGIREEEEAGEAKFTVSYTSGTAEHTLSVTASGRLASKDIEVEDTPAPVRATLESLEAKGTLELLEIKYEIAGTNYEGELTRRDGASRWFTIAADGKLSRFEVSLQETPAPVRTAVERHLVGNRLLQISRAVDDGEVSYEVDFEKAGKSRDFSVSAAGELESEQMFLAELPPPAQKTIRTKVGDGRLVRIDKTFEKRGGVLPFEVEAIKDGKAFNFSVGPHGRFLGMDE